MPNREPIAGEELIRLSLEAFHVHLQFENTALQIGVAFWITNAAGGAARIDPVKHQGDVSPLWSLIGERARSISWADEIEVAFTSGVHLRIPAAVDKAPRGTLMARGANDVHLVEDF